MRISMPLHLRRLLLGTSALTGLVALASAAQAGQPGLPTGGVVTAGKAAIAQAGSQMTIATGTARTVIDWQDFSIAGGNKVAIQQPTAASNTVNEVTGPNPSRIFGDLSSNGRVVLANPNGLWFGPDAHVDVAGLVASTATLSDAARKTFASGGRLSLDMAGKADASIVNDGRITIAGQGLAALVAPGVRNNGVIEATLGSVTLASGQASTLDFYGDGLVALAVTAPVTALALGPDGKPFRATIENNGRIAAGHVLVTADVVKGVVDSVINMSGVTEAKGVTVSGGDIVLDGGDGGVTVAGTLDATSAMALGGSVQVTGGAVTLAATATLDASGAQGGGTVQIGGGPHGGGSLRHAKTTTIAAGARVTANATVQGDGGTVSVWSDGATRFDGAISSRGAGTGNGGWVETSSTGALGVGATAKVDAGAPGGKAGSWLLDPHDITIQSGGADQYNPNQDSDPTNQSDLTIDPTALASQTGSVTLAASHNLTVSSALTMRSVGSLTLIGQNLIEVDAPITLTQAGANLTLIGGSAIDIAANISVPNLFSASVGAGGTFTQTAGSILTGGAGVAVYDSSTAAGSTISIGGMIAAPEIYLLASDPRSNQGGQIVLQATANLTNTNPDGSQDQSNRASTILYAGPGGGITLDPGMTIDGGRTNVALISDTLTVNTSSIASRVATFGRVIVAPASTDGDLQVDGTVVQFVGNSPFLLNFAPPGGVKTLTSIGVGDGAGSYRLSQAALTLLGGVPIALDGFPIMSVARFQIGLPGSTNTENFAGAITLPTETGNFAGNINIAANTTITIPGSSIQTFDTNGAVPGTASGLFLSLDETANSTGSGISIAAGARITVPGNIQMSSTCYSDSCTVTPTAFIGGTLTTGSAFFYSGSGKDQVTISPGALISSTGSPVVGGIDIEAASLNLGGTLLSNDDVIVLDAPILLIGNAIIGAAASNNMIELGSVDGAFGLTIDAGTGTVTTGTIGAKAALSSLTINAYMASLGSVTTSGAQTYTGMGSIGLNGSYAAGGFTALEPVLLTGNTTVTAGAGGILFGGTIDGGFDLTLDAGTAAVALRGAAGAKAALASLTVTAGTISLGNVSTTGMQIYNGTTTFDGTYTGSGFTANGADVLGGATGVTVGAGNIGFGGTLDGAQNLVLTAVNGTVSFGGAVGGTTALGSLTVTANGIVAGSVATTGAQTYTGAMTVGGTYRANGFTTGGPVVMLADTTIDGGTGDITLGDTVNGAFKLALTSSDANVFFFGTVGTAAARLSLLSIDGADTVTVEATDARNVSLFVHDFTATHIAGKISVGDHSLESDDSVNISAGSLEGHATAADLTIVTTGNVSGNFVVTGTSRITTGGDFTGSLQTRSGTITSGGDINGTITGTGAISLTATNISGRVTGGHVDLSASTVNANIVANSANISSDNVTVTGLIGGIDAGVSQATSSNITQFIQGSTQQIASNGVADGGVAKPDGDTTEDDRKKAKGRGAVYDFANRYIDDLMSGKPAH